MPLLSVQQRAPPGVKFLSQRLHIIFLPAILAFTTVSIIERNSNEPALPAIFRILIHTISYPLALTAYILLRDLNTVRKARQWNAILAPKHRDGTPGNLRTLFKGFRKGTERYIGDRRIPGVGLNDGGYTVNVRLLFQDRLFSTEPAHIKAVLATQFEQFEKGKTVRDTFKSLLGTGVFASDGEMWKRHRSTTRPFFSRDRISDFDIFDRHAEVVIRRMKDRFSKGQPLDFQDIISRFALDSATEFLFGQDINSLSAPLPCPFYAPQSSQEQTHRSDRYSTAFDAARLATSIRLRFGSLWPLQEFWKDKVDDHSRKLREFFRPVLNEAIRKKQHRDAGESESPGKTPRTVKDEETVLDHLVNYSQDPKLISDEIMNLAVAGRDTITCTLTCAVYMLAEHPIVLQKLQQEILDRVGRERRPTFDDFKEMRYMKAFINEVLRLYPAVPFNVRAAKQDTVLPPISAGEPPIFIPAGGRFSYSVLLMQRREDLWGPTAHNFDPDRFLDSRLHTYLTPNPFIFLPFNAGPRICLGQQFAYNEISFFLVRLLQNFGKIEMVEDAIPPEARPPAEWKEGTGRKKIEKVVMRSHLTMFVVGGLWVKMTETVP